MSIRLGAFLVAVIFVATGAVAATYYRTIVLQDFPVHEEPFEEEVVEEATTDTALPDTVPAVEADTMESTTVPVSE